MNFPDADTPLPPVSPELILELCDALSAYARGKLAGRNRAYAGPSDGLRNLRHCEAFDVPTEMGIIVRMSDKMQRIRMEVFQEAILPEQLGTTEHGLDNNDLPDLINYCLLLYAVRVIRSKSKPSDRMCATEVGLTFAQEELALRKKARATLERGIAHPSQRDWDERRKEAECH